MHFALVGDHADGLEMAQALAGTSRFAFSAFTGPGKVYEDMRRRGFAPKLVGDLEEVLSDPAIDIVIVAGRISSRPAQLRRALQSERHVLCVHPADRTPDIAYEAALIQGDTRRVLLPLLTEGLHPAVSRLADLVRSPVAPLGRFRLAIVERGSRTAIVTENHPAEHKPSFPGWDVLRVVGGEIAEVLAHSARQEVAAEDPVLMAGQFERGGLFQVSLIPGLAEPLWRFVAIGTSGQAELTFPSGWTGSAQLCWRDSEGFQHQESWPAWNPWPALVEIFESALAEAQGCPTGPEAVHKLRWQDAVRCLELDDAARRSIAGRRASTLEYQEVSEEVGFKGTMTLLGCGLLWVLLLLVVLSRWVPQLGWVIVPLLMGFLVLQILRWLIPRRETSPPKKADRPRQEDRA